MKLMCWLLGTVFDILSAIIIAWRERHRGFIRYAWYEFRARRRIIPYDKPSVGDETLRKQEESNLSPCGADRVATG
jgi:hypothetical protein